MFGVSQICAKGGIKRSSAFPVSSSSRQPKKARVDHTEVHARMQAKMSVDANTETEEMWFDYSYEQFFW